MIAQWIAYSIASSLLLGLAALALEKGLGRRWAVLRSLWAAALLGSMVCATVPWILPEQTRGTAVESRPLLLWSAPSPSTSSAPIEAVATAVPSASPSPVSLLGAPDLAELDPLLRYLCLLASGWLAIAIGLSLRTISRERRSWRRGSTGWRCPSSSVPTILPRRARSRAAGRS